MKTSAAVTLGKGDPFKIVDIDLDEPRAGEVRVRLVASGVCHTDAIVRDQWYPTPLPAVLGHEGAGIVDALGEGVTGIAVGDSVLLSVDSCGRCSRCASGLPTYCENMFALSFGGRRADGSTAFTLDGTPVSSHFFGQSSFARYANVSARSVVPVPAAAPLEVLAPLGCGIQTGAGAVLNALNPEAGSSIVIFGAGAVGLSGLLAAKIANCTTIIAVDMHQSRLDLALELGATHTIKASDPDVVEQIHAFTAEGAQYGLDTTGVPAAFTQMTKALAPRGHGAVVGAAAIGTNAQFDMGSLLPRGITISMVIEGDSVPTNFIPKLVDLHAKGLFPFDRLITSYPFEKINQAFEDSAAGSTLKPVVVF
ncbi:NAD(P)-dependent alcohol dehydrogenase [Arthrobacter sulfonylureivorans]|uniref:NAD(P)-dependent alcohol dehydrogenase n=1 Tax=Arthrobacter sulfonylureivorans TaxID=2486855 RepID=A0ABY3WBL8_9MICC|nr:NAD(P)-dependent alcohol dehydrogenase [Arthrobacter sulfonylureivorans]UNK47754.1 NAD(P)-dependent alcohol dehydrogenase [Arthrobacter sulfonylureivorans]